MHTIRPVQYRLSLSASIIITIRFLAVLIACLCISVSQHKTVQPLSSQQSPKRKRSVEQRSITTSTNMPVPSSSSSSSTRNVMHWFRTGLRLSDNPALVSCLEQLHDGTTNNKKNSSSSGYIYPVFVLDGNSYQLLRCSALRANFLVECLKDLDASLRERGSRLYVLEGDPTVILPKQWQEWNISHMSYEEDETGEPYAQQRDDKIVELAKTSNVSVFSSCSETLYPLKDYVLKNGGNSKPVPNSMTAFQKLFAKMPTMKKPLPAPTKEDFPPLPPNENKKSFAVPKRPTDLPWPRGIPKSKVEPLWDAKDCKNLTPIVRGGEAAALHALKQKLKDADWVATFEKPKTSPASLTPSTTVLSPYLSWGCLSPRQVWTALNDALEKSTTPAPSRSKPPVSLHGQVLWRDFNKLMAHDANDATPGCWNLMEGNKYSRQIPWDDDPKLLEAWKAGQTGFPWIDAAMRQLEREGWIHHLARHAVACFLTRGDLWQSWEEGAKHFEGQLLDADYALNGFNWLWLSCSGFFYQYFRCYSPIAFQKKNDPNGDYIRYYVPELKNLPSKYIYEPWAAPSDILKKAGVTIGKNYPYPIVDHATISKENMARMKQAYDAHKAAQESAKPAKKRQRTS